MVTISLGDTCVFRLAGVERRTAPFTDLVLRSGDLLVFGGPNRRIHHGVPKVLDGTRTRRPRPAARAAEHHDPRDGAVRLRRRAHGDPFDSSSCASTGRS